ncbi:MAG: DNA-directed RNA polymerase subunit N [Nanopusillaceae archaeon]
MIFPIRCFSCGKPIGHLWFKYKELLKSGKSPREAFEELQIEKMCCRQVFLGHVDLIETITKFKKF